ncbi:B-cell receptor-associated protein 29 [Dermatophagoides farinae]|uniref:Endoplasmic reticulum transmembrane protein n=1 Tax=Dermatophagoides farinae TaxID=6954 RepID=A0A922L340_DERFA|nr:B-cell receptor-associated protein 31-like [Dermatophagoides farinae]KAH7644536.1 b-cell receptor-associated protein 31-like protein [Dermatophagoides farinae]KAH9511566.1 b-cell receptor-associated protein [Dermatophagoides farinae]
MSLQWTLIATFLYVEIALIVLMLLSIIKPRFWRSFFQSRFMTVVAAQSNLYLVAFIGVLLLFFVESVREFHKYSSKLNTNDRMYVGSSAFYEDQMRVFRGQRNFYISGFALLCVFIIKRLIRLFGEMAQLKAESEASIRQARNAAELASQTLSASTKTTTTTNNDQQQIPLEKENAALKETIDELEKKLKKAQTDLKAMERQSVNTNKAFDEMAEKLARYEASADSRKDK